MVKVYVSGPITADNVSIERHNVTRAIEVGLSLIMHGHIPYIPHLSWFIDQHAIYTCEPLLYDWLELDVAILPQMDVVVRLAGSSLGADIEEACARENGIPVITINETCQAGPAVDQWVSDLARSVNEVLDKLPDDTACKTEFKTAEPKTAEQHYWDIYSELAELHKIKSQDYGEPGDPFANLRVPEGYGMANWLHCVVQAEEAMKRVRAFVRNGKLADGGSIQNALMDCGNFSLLGLAMYREEHADG